MCFPTPLIFLGDLAECSLGKIWTDQPSFVQLEIEAALLHVYRSDLKVKLYQHTGGGGRGRATQGVAETGHAWYGNSDTTR